MMHYRPICGLAALAFVYLRANETEISSALWAHEAWEGIYLCAVLQLLSM